MAKAYVLINAKSGTHPEVCRTLRELGAPIVAAELILGPFDLLATLEGADIDEIGRFVITRIQRIPQVERTLTCTVVEAKS